MKWFRFYNDAVRDPKVQQLPGDLFKTWVNILCIASKRGGQIPINELSQSLSQRWERSRREIDDLVRRGLLELGDGVIIPHNWYGRQYKSDNVTERTKRHKARKRNVPGNVPNAVLGTAPDKKKDLYLLNSSEDELREKKEVGDKEARLAPTSSLLKSIERWR